LAKPHASGIFNSSQEKEVPMRRFDVRSVVLSTLFAACTYSDLTPAGTSVLAVASRPNEPCKSLGAITGKGGGYTGAFVSNEELVEYARNDLRNKAGALGATHVLEHAPSFGSTGDSNTTTSATLTGEALDCRPGAAPIAANTSGGSVPVGCQYDSQCKGDRICSAGQCVAPAASPAAPAATVPQSAAPAAPAVSEAPAPANPAVAGAQPIVQ
jgi:hypothetical protein